MFDDYYVMEGDRIRRCKSIDEFYWAFKNRWHLRTNVYGKLVSTIFLVLDHNYSSEGHPVLFETMTFPDQRICIRYCLKKEAAEGHEKIVEQFKKLAFIKCAAARKKQRRFLKKHVRGEGRWRACKTVYWDH